MRRLLRHPWKYRATPPRAFIRARSCFKARKASYGNPDSTFDQIKPGTTSAAWVKATLGDPSECTRIDGQDDTEVWKYTYTDRKEGSGTVFLIFGGTSTKERSGTAYVELKDGVVTNKWRG